MGTANRKGRAFINSKLCAVEHLLPLTTRNLSFLFQNYMTARREWHTGSDGYKWLQRDLHELTMVSTRCYAPVFHHIAIFTKHLPSLPSSLLSKRKKERK